MKHHVANILCAAIAPLAGCSLLYNPSNLSTSTDGKLPPDAEIILDANPAALDLTKVTPSVLFEGQGVDGSRQAIVVVEGHHMVPGATISISAHTGETLVPMLMVDNTKVDIAADGLMMAVPVTLPVDISLKTGQHVRLDVSVTQPTGSGDITKTISAGDGDAEVLRLEGLDEMLNAPAPLAKGVHTFSKVDVNAGLTALANQDGGVIVRSTSSIKITGTSQFNASGLTPGAGGGAGGLHSDAPLVTGETPAMNGAGTGGGKASGGGGGFATTGGIGNGANPGAGGAGNVGDKALKNLAANRSGGGGGGNGKNVVVIGAANGGDGGGGGGAVELSAAGNLNVGAIEAKGANGSPGQTNGNSGGGGSGGCVLLRSGAALTAGTITVTGGNGGATGVASAGRIRFDAATGTVGNAGYRGPVFPSTNPLIVRDPFTAITVVGEASKTITYYIEDAEHKMTTGVLTVMTAQSGMQSIVPTQELFRGINHVCAVVEGVDEASEFPLHRAESENCIDVVYLYTAPKQ